LLIVGTLVLAVAPSVRGDTLKSGDTKAKKSDTVSLVGREIPDFILPDQSGKKVALSDHKSRRAVVLFFMGTGCPIANLYLAELAKLQKSEAANGLQVIGIQSNAGLTRDEIAAHAKEYKVAFPVLLDSEQRVADLLGANRTAEVFVLDEQRVVRYHGRVDDRFGYTYKRDEPRRRDLTEAVKEVLSRKKVSVARTDPLGCLITRVDRPRGPSNVTYAKEISRIVQQRCHECHRPGMIGPFSLLTYEDAVENSAMMKEVVTLRRMPPWHADPRYGHFSNNRRMPQSEVDTLIAWIDAGTPFGDKKDLPPPKEYAEGWVIDKPDIVFELEEEITIQADGVVPYRYYIVPTNFKEDVWIQAAEARPGNRAVVHHIIVFYRLPDQKDRVRNRGSICGTAPGDPPLILPPGVGKKIPAGAELMFQMHYTPTGKVEKDRSMVGLVLYKGDKPPKHVAKSKGIMNYRFKLPAGASNHEVRSSFTFQEDVRLLTLMPHMHLRGKDFIYRAKFPDGRDEILLSVPAYDFNWQNTYRFAEPLRLPRGTKIDCVAHFDNSAGNPANPDPKKNVRWGDQTWEEMMIGWVGYYPEKAR
jgi:peroxiredoxin